jgi:hypothetical protein
MIVGGNLAILGVQIDAGAAIGEGKKLDATIDGIGSSAEAAEKKLAGLGDAAAEAGGELGAAGRGAKNAGNEIGGANQQAGRSQASFGGMALAAGAALVVIEGLGTAVSMFTNFLGDAIENSDRASAAVDRMTAASDTLKAATGDGLAPALESLAGILEEIASDPAAVETFQDIGAAVGTVVELVGEAIAAFREYQTFLSSEMVALNPFSGVSREEVEQLRIVLEMQRQLAQEAYQRRQADKAAAGETDKARQAMEKWVATLKRQGEERSRAAARAASERDREEKQLDSLIDKYDRQGGALRQLEREERVLMRALEDGRRPVEDLTKALEELRKKREELDGGISQKWIGTIDVDRAEKSFITDKQLDDADKLLDKTKDITVEARSAGEEFYDWADSLDMAAGSLGDLNSDLGKTLSAAADIVASFAKLQELKSIGASREEFANASADLAGQVYGLGQGLGLFGPKGGTSQYGAQKEGNYSGEGSAVGAVIGAAIGTYFGATMQGAQIGAAAGGMIGSFVKKGADEALGQLAVEFGQVGVSISKSEGGLSSVLGKVGQGIHEALEQAMAALGGELGALPEVSLKVRDDVITVVVGAVKGKFDSMDDAISFATAEILKQGQITGMSENVRNAIANSTKESLEALLSDIDFAVSLDRVGMQPIEAAIEDYLSQYRAAVERATRLGLDTSKVGEGLAINLGQSRDAILGVQEDPAKRIQRESAIFNARIALLEAEETAKLSDLEFRRSILAAEIEVAKADASAKIQSIEISKGVLSADIAIAQAEYKLLDGKFAQLAALDAAIAASSALLANLPDLISESDIAKAISRARGGGDRAIKDFGNDFGRITGRWENMTQKWKDAQENLLDGLQRIALGESTTAFTGRERAMLAKSELDSLIGRARGGDVDAVGRLDDAFGDFAEIYKTFTGGGQGFLGDFRDVFSEYYEELQRIGTMERPSRTRTGNVVFDERFHRGQTEQLREQREHRRQAREDMRALTMAVHAGNQQARDLAEQIRREGRAYGVGR